MNDEAELRKFRKQATNQVIIILYSLVLIFVLFSFFSMSFNQQTFSSEAFDYAADAVNYPSSLLLPTIIFIFFLVLFSYVILIKYFATHSNEL